LIHSRTLYEFHIRDWKTHTFNSGISLPEVAYRVENRKVSYSNKDRASAWKEAENGAKEQYHITQNYNFISSC